MASLYPVFEPPVVAAAAPAEEQKYRPSVRFDFALGDFVRDGGGNIVPCSGREAFMQWCRKMAATERGACLAYSADQGAELEKALAQPDRAAVQSDFERTVTEALKVNPATEYVREFQFSTDRDGALSCRFLVKGRGWEEFPISILIHT